MRGSKIAMFQVVELRLFCTSAIFYPALYSVSTYYRYPHMSTFQWPEKFMKMVIVYNSEIESQIRGLNFRISDDPISKYGCPLMKVNISYNMILGILLILLR